MAKTIVGVIRTEYLGIARIGQSYDSGKRGLARGLVYTLIIRKI